MLTLRKLALVLIVVIVLLELATRFSSFLLPLAFSGVFSSVLLALVRRLRRRRVPDTLAITLGFMATLVVVGGVALLFILQARNLIQDHTLIRINLVRFYDALVKTIGVHFDISEVEQLAMLNQKIQEGVASILSFASDTVIVTTDIVLLLTLVPFYSFLLIAYRHQLVKAICAAYDAQTEEKVLAVLERMRWVVGQYVIGMFMVMVIMAVGISLGLWVLGVPHPIFFGTLGAVMNLVPYVGISSVALLTAGYGSLYYGSASMLLPILIVFVVANTIEGYLITPYVVGHKTSLNPLAVILTVVFGGYLWGIAGMILALPYLAALAALAEAVPGLLPLAMLVRLDKPTKTDVALAQNPEPPPPPVP